MFYKCVQWLCAPVFVLWMLLFARLCRPAQCEFLLGRHHAHRQTLIPEPTKGWPRCMTERLFEIKLLRGGGTEPMRVLVRQKSSNA